MASKFQNRLAGTIVLVALGVSILPGLLDGQKKHYQDEFAAIPLVPKPGDRDEPDMLQQTTLGLAIIGCIMVQTASSVTMISKGQSPYSQVSSHVMF